MDTKTKLRAFRLPHEIYERLRRDAKKNHRTITGHLIEILKAHFSA